MNVVRAAIGMCGLALLGLALWAAFAKQDLHGGFWLQFDVLTTLPWGLMTLFDLYAGLVMVVVLIFMVERSWLAGALWAAPVLVLGNIWTALWLVVRLPYLARRLSEA